MSNLPQLWEFARLGELGRWSGGGTPSKENPQYWKAGTVPWVSPKDMKRDRIVDAQDHITSQATEESPAKIVPAGSVLVVTRSGILQHTLPVGLLDVDAAINQDLKALTPHRGVDADYMAHALRAHARVILHECTKDGTTVHSVDTSDLLDFEIPVAPTAEQKRIVDAVDSLMTRLDDAVACLQRVQRNLKRYRAAVLQAAVEGRLVPPEAELARAEGRSFEPATQLLERILTERRRRWEESELAKLRAKGKEPKNDAWKAKYVEAAQPERADEVRCPEGWFLSSVDAVGDVLLGRQRAPQYLTGQWTHPYLRVANVKDDALALDDIEAMDFDHEHLAKYRLEPGDILVSEGQSPELVGQSAIYRGGIGGLCFQKTLHRFRPFVCGPSSEFSQIVFRAHVRTRVFMRRASITTNIAHLTLEKFKACPFPLPPMAEQVRITSEVSRLVSMADETGLVVTRNLTRCARLRQSILKWAFEGKLVDQDPTDEPASVLLERIRAEQLVQPTSGSRRRSTKKSDGRKAVSE